MPFEFKPATHADMRAVPRIDTHTLGLDNFLNPDAQLNGYALTREDLDGVMGQQFDYKTFMDFAELTGRVESINTLEFWNYEAGLMERSVKVASIVAGSTAGVVTFTLDPDSYSSTGSINGPIDRSPLKVNDLILTTKNQITGLVISKSGSGTSTQYTAIRRNAVSEDLLDALTNHQTSGQRLITYSDAFSEGSKSPTEGSFMSTIRLYGQMQTFRSYDAITGDVDALKMSIPWNGKTLQLDKSKLIQEWSHRMAVNRAMFLSPGGDFTIPGSGPGTGRVRLTTGLYPGVKQLGATFGYDPVAGYSAADIDALDAQAKANHSGSSFTVFEGYQHGSAFYKGIKEQLGGGIAAIDFSAFGTKGDPKQKALDLGFNSVRTPGGISYHRQESSFFNEPEVTGTAGYIYPKVAIFVPGGSQAISVEENGAKTTLQVPSLRLLHTTASNGDKRRFHTWVRGKEQDGEDALKMETLTQQGIQVVNLRNFIAAEPQ